MADRPIIAPQIHSVRNHGRPELLGGETGIADASNSFIAHSFVTLSAGALVAVADGGVATVGLCLDASKDDVIDPPDNFHGDKHWPVNPQGVRFAVSVVDGSENVGEANGAPQLSEVVIGTAYGIKRLSDGTHCLDVDNTTNDFFVVVEKPSRYAGVEQDANTYNPVVIVEIIPAAIIPV